jgi:hypothetical protein
MSYVFPPRQKPSDYRKSAITQDELLKIAIANDNNISLARRALKMGEVQQLTPIQSSTPDELLMDISKQESDARLNLLKLGFRDQEVSTIIADLINEPDVLRALNINFPAIEADVKRRFNPRLLTPSFFLNYLREYNETLNASRGLDVNSSASIRRQLNAFVNSIGELKSIIPDPSVIEYIRSSAENQRFIGQDTIDRLQKIEDWVRYGNSLSSSGNASLGSSQQFSNIQEVLDALQDLPDKKQIDDLYRALSEGADINTRNIINRINAIASAAPRQEAPSFSTERVIEEEEEDPRLIQERIKQERDRKAAQSAFDNNGDPRRLTPSQQAIYAQLAGVSRVAPTISDLTNFTGTTTQTLTSSLSLGTATLAQIKSTFRTNPDLANQLSDSDGNTINYNDLQKTKPKAGSKKVWIEDTNIEEIFRAKFGRGLMNKRVPIGLPKPSPSGSSFKKIKIGKGLSVKEQPTYKEFGKYAIHIPQLEQQDLLNLKYKSLGGIPKFKPVAVSDIFRDFLLDLLESGKVNQRVYLQIEPKERKIFEEIAIGAGIWNSLGLKRTTTSTDEEERKRFELLKGEYIAGNNSPKVLQELRQLVIKFINDGRLRKTEGMNLLIELSV